MINLLLKVLVDNYTYIDQYYLGEPAVCYYLEEEEEKILFDVGYSDVFIHNAEQMGININDVSNIICSHGHNDHIGGFSYFGKEYGLQKKTVIAHPETFIKKIFDGEEIGSLYSTEEMNLKCKLKLSKDSVCVTKNIVFLGEIPNYFNFEKRNSIGEKNKDGINEKDFLVDDTAIAYKTSNGIFIITGCSHSGICNIIEHAKRVCKEKRVIGVLGGFHLFEVDERLNKTIDYFRKSNITNLYPCHCVSFDVKAEINKYIKVNEVGVGLKIEL